MSQPHFDARMSSHLLEANPHPQYQMGGGGGGGGMPDPHASTHYSGESDELLPGDIGAEVEGAAESAIISHVGEVDPHPQYWREDEFIPWANIIGAPSGANPPPLNFTPLTTPGGELVVVLGTLPIAVTPSDPPVGNEGQDCWESQLGQQTWRTPFYFINSEKFFRTTGFVRKIPTTADSRVIVTLEEITTTGTQIVRSSSGVLILGSPAWTQFDISWTSSSTSTGSQIAAFFRTSTNPVFQLYAPQLSDTV